MSDSVFAGDAVAVCELLCRLRHVESAVAVHERNHQRVFQISAAEAETGACATEDERSLAHVLHPAGKTGGRFIELDRLAGGDNAL